MNRIWTVLGLALVIGVASHDVDAKRAGKGSSVGAQRSSAAAAAPKQTPPAAAPAAATPTQAAAAPAAAKAPAAAPAPVAPPKSGLAKWGPMLGGLALGGLLGSMLGGGALGSILGMLANVLLIGGLVFLGLMLWRKFKSGNASPQPAFAGAGAGASSAGGYNPPIQRQSLESPSFGGNAGSAQPVALAPVEAAPEPLAAAPNVPAGFDVAGFSNGAKGMFNRLQAAYDKGDAASLKDMSTDEMYAELDRELKANGPQKHATEVVTLNAEVIEVTTEEATHWASVRFSGLIREDGREMAEPFDEIWNMSKPVSGAHGWVLAGIQQLS